MITKPLNKQRLQTGVAVAASTVLAVTALVGSGASAASVPKVANSSSPKVLTFWQWRPQDTPGIAKIGQLFQQETGYKLEIRTASNDTTYYTMLEAAARDGTLPDVVALNYGTTPGDNAATLAKAGLLVNLTKYFTPDWRKEFAPAALQTGLLTKQVIDSTGTGPTSLRGLTPNQIWALPYMSGSADVVYVRKSALRAAHLSTTTPPETYQQWVAEITATRKALGPRGGIVMGLAQSAAPWEFLFRSMSYSLLGMKDYLSRASAHPIVSYASPKSIEELQLYNELTPLWIPGALSLDITPAHDAFVAGKASWYVGGTFSMSGIVGGGVPVGNLLAFFIPPVAGGAVKSVKYATIGLAQAAITTQAKVPLDVSLKFLRLLTGPVGGTLFAQYGHNIPAAELTAAEWAKAPTVHLMAEALAPSGGFDPYLSTQDPPTATPITVAAGEILDEITARALTPEAAGRKLAALYAAAWAGVKK